MRPKSIFLKRLKTSLKFFWLMRSMCSSQRTSLAMYIAPLLKFKTPQFQNSLTTFGDNVTLISLSKLSLNPKNTSNVKTSSRMSSASSLKKLWEIWSPILKSVRTISIFPLKTAKSGTRTKIRSATTLPTGIRHFLHTMKNSSQGPFHRSNLMYKKG